jgi:hypothetical protein
VRREAVQKDSRPLILEKILGREEDAISAPGPKPKKFGRAEHVRSARGFSDLNLFRYRQCIVDFNAEIPDRAFDLGVAKQDLHCAEIAGAPVD